MRRMQIKQTAEPEPDGDVMISHAAGKHVRLCLAGVAASYHENMLSYQRTEKTEDEDP